MQLLLKVEHDVRYWPEATQSGRSIEAICQSDVISGMKSTGLSDKLILV